MRAAMATLAAAVSAMPSGAQADSSVVTIANANATAQIHVFGATVLSWKPHGAERLYLSPAAVFDGSKPIRGGIPLVFPQFGTGPITPGQHGFARARRWTLAGRKEDEAVFELESDASTRTLWPHDFALRYIVALEESGALRTTLVARNTDSTPFEFTALFHTYLAADVERGAAVTGLHGATHVDHMTPQPWQDTVQTEERVSVGGAELERVYLGAPDSVGVETHMGQERCHTRLVRDTAALPDLVVWNPWHAKAATMADLTPGGYMHFVCVEAGAIGAPVVLAPGAEWSATQTLHA